MTYDFRRIFNPTPEEEEEDRAKIKKLHDELAKKKGCSTCKNTYQVRRLPGFVTGEECICKAGLECDTVMFKVENCEKYEEADPFEENDHDPILDDPRYTYIL